MVICATITVMKQTLYLIRHGHTAGTESALMYGATELPLTKDGLDDIAGYSDAGIYPDPEGAAVYTSGMIRALQTLAVMYGADPADVHVSLEDIYPEKDDNIERVANDIAELCSVPHDTEPMLREVDLGAYEMMTVDEILEYEFGRKWIGGEIDEPDFPGGDTDRGFQDRINRGLWDVLKKAKADGLDRIIIVSHGGVITYIMNKAFPGRYDNKWIWCPKPGTGYKIEIEDSSPVSWTPVGDIGENETPTKDL